MSFSDGDKELIRSLCNEVTYMMFDLENGNHIRPDGSEVDIDGQWKFKYTAKLLSDTIEETPYGPMKTIVKDFTISVSNADRPVIDFDFNQQTRGLKVRTIDAFYVSMFLDILDAYRRKMFNVPEPNQSGS
ncbi:hypothetical protein [Stenotrophomonas phage RAS14]